MVWPTRRSEEGSQPAKPNRRDPFLSPARFFNPWIVELGDKRDVQPSLSLFDNNNQPNHPSVLIAVIQTYIRSYQTPDNGDDENDRQHLPIVLDLKSALLADQLARMKRSASAQSLHHAVLSRFAQVLLVAPIACHRAFKNSIRVAQ